MKNAATGTGRSIDWKLGISIVALLASVVTFSFSYHLSRQTAITSVRPVLVFEFSDNNGWRLRNVGNGPALNVVVAMKEVDSDWKKPVRIPPISQDGAFKLIMFENWNVKTLGAYYSDINQKVYSSTCTEDLSETHEGNKLKAWPDSEIGRHWHYPESDYKRS